LVDFGDVLIELLSLGFLLFKALEHFIDGGLLLGFGCFGIEIFEGIEIGSEVVGLFAGEVLEAFFEIGGIDHEFDGLAGFKAEGVEIEGVGEIIGLIAQGWSDDAGAIAEMREVASFIGSLIGVGGRVVPELPPKAHLGVSPEESAFDFGSVSMTASPLIGRKRIFPSVDGRSQPLPFIDWVSWRSS
jgi:hypothetical protein